MKKLLLTSLLLLLPLQLCWGAFPTTGVLDNFNRGDSSTIGTNWTPLFFVGSTQPAGVYSNRVGSAVSQYSNYAMELYNVATYGADCEAYITITTVGSYDEADTFDVFARMTTLSKTTTDGYAVEVLPAGSNDVWKILKITDFAATTLGATFTQHISNGDKIGIACVGSDIQAWYCASGGSWTKLANRTDTTYTAAGYIGFYATSEWVDWAHDDFGGGTITASSAIKTINGLVKNSCKTWNGLAIASVKSVNGLQ